jgi:peptidoglycan/xylan/chitin deacetylase (PgdA/CDA1 family)
MINSCKIVMYHYVRPIKNSKYPEIKGLELDGFIRQIEYFKKNFTFITAKQLLSCICEGDLLPKNSILLTFDDGLKDHFLHVFPVLQKLNIQGLFFPTAETIESKKVIDVHKIHFILANCENKNKIIDEIFTFINKNKKEYALNSPESYFKELAIPNRFDTKEVIFIKRILQRALPRRLRSQIVDYLFKKFVTEDEKSFSEELYLSYDDIHEMQESGMYFGSHGYSHEWLTYLNETELNLELKKMFEFNLKINKNNDDMIMCYPYGNHDENLIKKLTDEGYKAGLTTIVGDSTLDEKNAFLLKRFDTNDFPQ